LRERLLRLAPWCLYGVELGIPLLGPGTAGRGVVWMAEATQKKKGDNQQEIEMGDVRLGTVYICKSKLPGQPPGLPSLTGQGRRMRGKIPDNAAGFKVGVLCSRHNPLARRKQKTHQRSQRRRFRPPFSHGEPRSRPETWHTTMSGSQVCDGQNHLHLTKAGLCRGPQIPPTTVQRGKRFQTLLQHYSVLCTDYLYR
jgi:hypothetical protein